MSLLSAIILPKIEKELIALEPQIASFVVMQISNVVEEVAHWIEHKAKPAALSQPQETQNG